MNILYNTLNKSGGTKDHCKQVKLPGTTLYLNASRIPS